MAKLPKAIIKKYGITKKAWQVFRGVKKQTRKTIQVKTTMARRRGFRGFRKKHYSHSSGGISPMKIGITAAAYGAFRPKIHSMIPDTGIPYSDSLITGAIGYYLAGKKGWMKNAGVAILAVEAAAVGANMLGGMGTSAGTSNTVNLSNY